jgi:DNA repair photolyase
MAGHEQETNDMEAQCLARRMPVHLGGTADPFPRIEKRERATLSILKILADNNYPTILSTKGTTVVDSEYIKEFEKIPIILQVTITTLDEKIARIIEPNAPTPRERLEVVRSLSNMGFRVSVRNEPYFPLFPDSTYEDYMRQIADAGATHVSCAPIRIYSQQHHYFKDAFGEEWLRNMLTHSEGYLGYKRLKREYILNHSRKLKTFAETNGLGFGGAADIDNLMSKSECCCYPLEEVKEFENFSKFNLYHAARIAKEKGTVTMNDMDKEWRPSGKMYEKSAQSYTHDLPQWQSPDAYFLHQWDRGKTNGMVLDDVEGIYFAGNDENGHAIYKYEEPKRLKLESF